MLPSIVTLPKSRSPVFPDMCISCGASSPGALYRASTHAVGWWTWLLWSFGKKYQAEVPACAPCRDRMVRQRWLQLGVNVVFIVAGVWTAGWLLAGYQGPFKAWLMMGIALVCLLPLFVWETIFPKPFDMTATAEKVDYEFRDRDYATRFAALNSH